MASAGSNFVDLLLNDTKYAAGLNRATRNTSAAANTWQRDVNKTRDSFSAVINPVDNITTAVARLGGVVAGALSVQQLVQYSDTWKQLEGRLNIVAGQFDNIGSVQSELFAIAQRTRQPLEGITNFYSRLAQFIPEAERAQYDLLGVTESVSTALAITGETSASSTAAMIQFTQAIGTNFEAAGQELRSLQEQAPRLTQALMKALGDGTKSLQQLKDEGLLTRQSVLNALSGMGEEGRRLAEELAKVPVTVGQAFTQLDNALLKYVGQSELANGATGALSATIVGLANNIDIVTNSIVFISSLYAARLIPGLVGSTAAFVSANIAAAAYTAGINSTTAALGANSLASTRWAAAVAAQQAAAAGSISATTIAVNRAGQAAVVTTSAFGVMSVAARGLGASLLALVGGPIGAGFLALGAGVAYLWQQMDQAKLVSQDYAEKSSRLFQIQQDLTKASGARSVALRQERDDILAVALAEIKRTEASLKYLEVAQRASKEGGGIFGIGMSAGLDVKEKQTRDRLAAQYSELDQLNTDLNRMMNQRNSETGSGPPGAVSPSKEAKKAADDLSKAYERNRQYILGLDKDTLKYKDTLGELDTLLKSGKISQDEFNTAVQGVQKEFEEASNKGAVWAFDMEEAGKQASRNIQSSFADFLFDPLDKGFEGLLDSFSNTLQRMAAEAASAQILGAIFGTGGISFPTADSVSNGTSGGFLGGLFDGFFADGGFIKPGHFGVAGEAGAELIYGGNTGASVIPMGGGGAGSVSINIINNNGSSVTANQRQTNNGLDIEVMIDQAVASNIASPGSRTNQALGAYTNRGYTKR